jgi:hypothetical protein
MAELPVSELISLAEALGIIGTLFMIFFFSRKEMRSLSIDIETKEVLNDLDEKIHVLSRRAQRITSDEYGLYNNPAGRGEKLRLTIASTKKIPQYFIRNDIIYLQ